MQRFTLTRRKLYPDSTRACFCRDLRKYFGVPNSSGLCDTLIGYSHSYEPVDIIIHGQPGKAVSQQASNQLATSGGS